MWSTSHRRLIVTMHHIYSTYVQLSWTRILRPGYICAGRLGPTWRRQHPWVPVPPG